jgi:hypothetical protein
MEEVIEVEDIRTLARMITDIPNGVMLEVELGEEETLEDEKVYRERAGESKKR